MDRDELKKRVIALRGAISRRVQGELPPGLAVLAGSQETLLVYELWLGGSLAPGERVFTPEWDAELVEFCQTLEGLLKMA